MGGVGSGRKPEYSLGSLGARKLAEFMKERRLSLDGFETLSGISKWRIRSLLYGSSPTIEVAKAIQKVTNRRVTVRSWTLE
jgi:hypothetical protein